MVELDLESFDGAKAKTLEFLENNPDALAANFVEIALYEAGQLGDAFPYTHQIRRECSGKAMNTAHFVANQILDDVTQNGLDHTRRPITRIRLKFFKSKGKRGRRRARAW